MKTIYRIYNDWTETQVLALKAHDVPIVEGYGRIDVEDKPENKELLNIIDNWKLQKFYWTEYNKKDFLRSGLFALAGMWQNGYPMPDNDGGYNKLTYDLQDDCSECGIGRIQKSSFRIGKIPKWGGRMVFGLTWVNDEIFVRKELYEAYFRKMGIESLPVHLYRNDKVIENTVQLRIPKTNVPLRLDDQLFYMCKKCGRKKFDRQLKGYFPGFAKDPGDLKIFKSQEYFGSGHEASNQIFITKRVWNDLQVMKAGISVYPVEPNEF